MNRIKYIEEEFLNRIKEHEKDRTNSQKAIEEKLKEIIRQEKTARERAGYNFDAL